MNRDIKRICLAGAAAVVALPFLLFGNIAPIPTFVNQWASLFGVAVVVLALNLTGLTSAGDRIGRATTVATGIFVALAGAQLVTSAPWAQRLIPLGALVLSASLVWSVSRTAGGGRGGLVGSTLMTGLAVAALGNVAIGMVQVFVPQWTSNGWLVPSAIVGRAYGHVRHPNLLATLLLWGCGAMLWMGLVRRWGLGVLAPLMALLVLGVALTVSRTGAVCVGLLMLWGVVDRRLPVRVRVLLVALGLVYMAGWRGLELWSEHTHIPFYGDDQLQKTVHGDASSSRGRIWRDTWALILQHPWAGVGPGAFNFEWSLSVFPDRAIAFFDHAHNLPMQLAVESGIPFALGVMGAVAWLIWKASLACRSVFPEVSLGARVLCWMLLVVGVHSLLEYPLWFAHFLMPTAVMLGWLVGLSDHADASAEGPVPVEAEPVSRPKEYSGAVAISACVGAVMLVACLWSAHQYYTVALVFAPERAWGGESESLADRIQRGRESVLFGHHADYVHVTMAEHPEWDVRAFDRPLFHLLDARLMAVYARVLNLRGESERADHVAARLREFRNPQAAAFFQACLDDPARTHFPCAGDPGLRTSDLRPENALPSLRRAGSR